jgi:transposase
MAKAYPQELRDRVLAAYQRGMKTHQIAEVFVVSKAWARRVKQRMEASGETTPRPRGGAWNVKIDPDRLRELVERHPDATAAEYHAMLGIDCSVSAVDQALRRHGLTDKKRRSWRPSRTART